MRAGCTLEHVLLILYYYFFYFRTVLVDSFLFFSLSQFQSIQCYFSIKHVIFSIILISLFSWYDTNLFH